MTLKGLTELDWAERCKHTKMRSDYVPRNKYTDKTAAGLEAAICRFITLMGYQAERIKNTGRAIDNTKVVTDALGFSRKIGSVEYVRGTGTNGTADISATVKGRSVKWEVKIGNDRQSEAQKKYQDMTERSGGLYFIVRNFEDFINQYNQVIN